MVIRASLLALLLRFWLPLVAVCWYALRRGGTPERLVAAMLLAAALSTLILRVEFARRYMAVQPAILVIDVLLLCGLLFVAIRADRGWPMILAALHGVTILGHVGKTLNPNLWALGYATMIAVPVLPGLAVLAIGTRRHALRVRRSGVDRDWSAS